MNVITLNKRNLQEYENSKNSNYMNFKTPWGQFYTSFNDTYVYPYMYIEKPQKYV